MVVLALAAQKHFLVMAAVLVQRAPNFVVQKHPLIIVERISDPGNATGHSLGVRATAAALSFVVQRHLLDHHLCSQEQRLPIVHLCGFPPLLLMLEKGRAA